MSKPAASEYQGVPVISVAAMRAADQRTIDGGVPSLVLMQRAAQGIYDAYPYWAEKRTLILCGSGNNGGDGYALAGILHAHHCDVTLLRASEKFSEDGRYYYEQCRAAGIPELAGAAFDDYDVLVDCLLGTGFAGVPREPLASVIRAVNAAKEGGAFVISADINSGMNGDTGEADLAVKSDLTVSIGYYKKGMFCGRSKELIGGMTNVDIGIRL